MRETRGAESAAGHWRRQFRRLHVRPPTGQQRRCRSRGILCLAPVFPTTTSLRRSSPMGATGSARKGAAGATPSLGNLELLRRRRRRQASHDEQGQPRRRGGCGGVFLVERRAAAAGRRRAVRRRRLRTGAGGEGLHREDVGRAVPGSVGVDGLRRHRVGALAQPHGAPVHHVARPRRVSGRS